MNDVIRYEREENPIRLDFGPIKSDLDITNINNRRGTMMSSHYLEVQMIESIQSSSKKGRFDFLDCSKKSSSSRSND